MNGIDFVKEKKYRFKPTNIETFSVFTLKLFLRLSTFFLPFLCFSFYIFFTYFYSYSLVQYSRVCWNKRVIWKIHIKLFCFRTGWKKNLVVVKKIKIKIEARSLHSGRKNICTFFSSFLVLLLFPVFFIPVFFSRFCS